MGGMQLGPLAGSLAYVGKLGLVRVEHVWKLDPRVAFGPEKHLSIGNSLGSAGHRRQLGLGAVIRPR